MAVARGRFITVEGQDGAGKTTNLKLIGEVLVAAGIDVVETREPGGTVLGEELRRLVLSRRDLQIDPVAELLMIFAARAQHIAEKLEPALAAGRWVLCDRFTDATYAYQGGGRGIPPEVIAQLEALVQNGLQPDLTLLFDVDVETGQTRVEWGGATDRFESESTRFKRAVRDCYLDLARHYPRIRIIDATRPLSEVQAEVREIIEAFVGSCQG